MRFFAAIPLLLAGAFVASMRGCSNETVVVGQLPTTDAGTAAPPPTRCSVNGDCAQAEGYYCSLPACGATDGTCVIPDLDCPATELPVCGCDGITYFNDCLRAANGVGSSTPNPCQTTSCGGPSNIQCPSGTYCAQFALLPHEACTPDIPGTCWVLPPQCPSATPANYWDSCQPGGAVCQATCTAILTGGPFHRSQRCLP